MGKSGQKFLVTGAAGFLGSNLIERALADGHEIVGVDNLSMGRVENLADFLSHPRFRFVQRDVTAPNAFEGLGTDFDVVTHLAAFKIPRYGKAIDTLKINYQGTERALDYARDLGCKIVLASTSDVYGRNPQLPFSEERSDSVIGLSKLFDEHLGLAYAEAYGFPVTILRFFGSYGPRQHLSWWAGPQSVFIDCVLNDKPIPIHGDGRQTRSFTYVTDTVEGIYQSMLRPQANGEIINVGSTEEITILDLAHRIKRLSGTAGAPKIDFIPYESFTGKKYEDVMRRVPDVSLCERLLGVRARVGIDDGLARTIEWQRRVTAARARTA
jgi:UDP-glucose 4-epimerase